MTIPLKQWCAEEAVARKTSVRAIYNRIYRGKYPWLAYQRTNKRIVFVDVDASYDWLGLGPITEGL